MTEKSKKIIIEASTNGGRYYFKKVFNMKKYAVRTAVEMKVYVYVYANSKDEAVEKACQLNESDFLKAEVEDVSTIDVQSASEC